MAGAGLSWGQAGSTQVKWHARMGEEASVEQTWDPRGGELRRAWLRSAEDEPTSIGQC